MTSRLLTIILLLLWPYLMMAQPAEVRLQRLTYAEGLSDQKVNCILKSRDGYLWVGTPLGLNRFDGLRVHSFFNRPGDASSLPDNTILSLSEDADGMLWVETPAGYCIFNPITDKVERNTAQWLSQCGMKGKVLRVASDGKRNLWIVTDQYRLYYYDFSSKKALLVAADKGALAHISFLYPKDNRCLLTSANGTIAFADVRKRRIVSVDRSIAAYSGKNYYGSQPAQVSMSMISTPEGSILSASRGNGIMPRCVPSRKIIRALYGVRRAMSSRASSAGRVGAAGSSRLILITLQTDCSRVYSTSALSSACRTVIFLWAVLMASMLSIRWWPVANLWWARFSSVDLHSLTVL